MSAIYLVKTPAGNRLVEAGSKTVAINHVVKHQIECAPITASELLQFMQSGMQVEKAGASPSNQGEKQEPDHIPDTGEMVDQDAVDPVQDQS